MMSFVIFAYNISFWFKRKRVRVAVHVALSGEKTGGCKVLVVKRE
jgi:hypothetical protein